MAALANRSITNELPRNITVVVTGDNVEWKPWPIAIRVSQVIGRGHSLETEDAADRHRIEPDSPHRNRCFVVRKGWADDGSVRGFKHVLDKGIAAFDVDRFMMNPARHEVVANPDARPVGADLLEEEVGVVRQTGGDAPRAVPVEADGESGSAKQRRSCNLPVRSGNTGEIPV